MMSSACARAREKEARDVARVDRLDEQLDPGFLQLERGEFQVGDEGGALTLGGGVGTHARQAVQLLALQRLRVFDRLAHAVLKFADAIGMAGDAAFAFIPIPGGQVVQHLGETVLLQRLGELLLGVRVREHVLHALEARSRRGGEAVHERMLVEEQGEIRAELGHGDTRNWRMDGGRV